MSSSKNSRENVGNCQKGYSDSECNSGLYMLRTEWN